MKDKIIQALLNSDIREDKILGRIHLLKKYPKILENSIGHWKNDPTQWDVSIEIVEKYSPITMPKRTREHIEITGFVIEKELLEN